MSTHVSMHDLLEAGAHFGHQSRYWNPKMQAYIYGALRGIHIVNLQHTLPALRQAQAKARELGRNRNKLLFVGTKRAAREHIKQAALSIGQPYANQRWLGGMLTNYKTIRASIKVYNDLKAMFEDGTISKLTKKEALLRQRKLDKLEQSIGGIKDMGGLPDAVFIVDIDREHIAVTETSSLGIPIMAMVDTNCNPDLVDYLIPCNDDSGKTIKLIVDSIAAAYAEGAREAEQLNPITEKGPRVSTAREKRKAPSRIRRGSEVAAKAPETDAKAEPAPEAVEAVAKAEEKSARTKAASTAPKTATEAAPETASGKVANDADAVQSEVALQASEESAPSETAAEPADEAAGESKANADAEAATDTIAEPTAESSDAPETNQAEAEAAAEPTPAPTTAPKANDKTEPQAEESATTTTEDGESKQ